MEDLRGLWRVVEVTHEGQVQPVHRALGSVQRVEQAGDRIVICGGGVVQDNSPHLARRLTGRACCPVRRGLLNGPGKSHQ